MSVLKDNYNSHENIDQLIVRVGKGCNFKCNFCNVSTNERHVKLKENINDIVRNFLYKVKYSTFKHNEIVVTISGGEPSIFPQETLFALKFITNFFLKKGIKPSFDIQTNGANISYAFAKKLKEYGVTYSLVSFHTNDPIIFEKLIGVSYNENYFKILDGINNLNRAGIQVGTNTILGNDTKENFYDTLVFLEMQFPFIKHFNIGLIQPHGEALVNIKTIYPKYIDVYAEYNRAMFYLLRRGHKVTSHFVGLPACYIGHFKQSLEVSTNSLFRRNFDFDKKYLINNINDQNKTHISDCSGCMYNNVCSGIWKEYEDLQKLLPVKYIKDFSNKFEKNTFCYKLQSVSENLSKIYDSNIRQIIIPTNIGGKQEIVDLLKKSLAQGFYKISLLVNNDFILDEKILLTGVTNIQVDIESIELDFIQSAISFSHRFSPQFKMNLDISIYSFSKKILKKVIQLYTIDKRKEVNLHFIFNGNNKDVRNYTKFFNKKEKNIFFIPQ